ncbi:MAG: hypothetical protein, partial [Olavius algarvensis Gamma 1 endosymbiont]
PGHHASGRRREKRLRVAHRRNALPAQYGSFPIHGRPHGRGKERDG